MTNESVRQAIESLDGNYELIREIGRGATAIVYLLRDLDLERDVALKLIRGGLGVDEEAAARLRREAHLVAQLHHPNIVKLFSSQQLPDGSVVLMMEHVPGRNLKEILSAEGGLPIPRVLEIMKDVASALAYAHRRKIVHRDVKPENIYIDEEVGAARLADFGVARPWDQDSRLTVPGASLGTPAYMSPEQVDGKDVDGRSDVYSLGLVGYEMILGHHPWEGENVFTTIFKQKNEDLPMDLPGLDRYPALARVLQWCLQKDRDARWGSADILLKELQEVTPLRRKDDPVHWEILPESVRSRRRGEEPSTDEPFPEDGEVEIDWSAIDWEALDPVDPPAADSPTEDEDGEDEGGKVLLPSVLEEGETDETARILGWDEDTPPRGLRSPWIRTRILLGLSFIVLISGAYGGYRWLARPAPEGRVDSFIDGPGEGGGLSPGASLLVLRGGNIRAEVGSAVQLALRASNAQGEPLVDTLVLFRIVEGQGSLEGREVRTGEGGLAEVALQLPAQRGEVVVEANLPGSPTTWARFQVSVLPGAPASVTRITGDGQVGPPGAPLPDFVGVRVQDAFGNPLPDLPVRFQISSGGGLVQPRETRTDGVGRAFARWTLGPDTGSQALSVVVPWAPDSLVSFRATAALSTGSETTSEAEASAPAPPLRVRSRAFVIGGSYVCGLRDESVACRGNMDRGQGGGESVPGLRALTAGVSHGCGLQGDGTAWCWGANESGQLGDGTTQDRDSAVRVDTDTRFSLLVGGLSHTCGLAADGGAFCWGRNLNGQLGDGSRTDRARPAPVAGGLTFETLMAGWNHTCGLTESGEAFCWGLNGSGQLGDGTRVDRLTPTPVPGTFQSLAAGASHTCGIRGTGVLCWGEDSFGQLGDGGEAREQTVPVPVVTLPSRPISLAAGAVHACALLQDGSIYCWGQNLHGQLGNGENENSLVPRRVAGNLRFNSVYAGGAVTCGFARDGAEYCWGLNQGGQLGDGTRVNRAIPVRVREEPDPPQSASSS